MILSHVTSTRGLSFAALASAAALAAMLTGCSGAPDDGKTEEPAQEETIASTQQAQRKGGGGSGGSSCVDRWQSCYIGCGVDHPEGDMRDGCEDSCDASYRLCTIYGGIGGGGGGVIMR